jgi:hypothetical protein
MLRTYLQLTEITLKTWNCNVDVYQKGTIRVVVRKFYKNYLNYKYANGGRAQIFILYFILN